MIKPRTARQVPELADAGPIRSICLNCPWVARSSRVHPTLLGTKACLTSKKNRRAFRTGRPAIERRHIAVVSKRCSESTTMPVVMVSVMMMMVVVAMVVTVPPPETGTRNHDHAAACATVPMAPVRWNVMRGTGNAVHLLNRRKVFDRTLHDSGSAERDRLRTIGERARYQQCGHGRNAQEQLTHLVSVLLRYSPHASHHTPSMQSL